MKMSKIIYAAALLSALVLWCLVYAQAGAAMTPAPIAATPTGISADAAATKVNDHEILPIVMSANDGRTDQVKQTKKSISG
ncbi:MAG: hypothetical protein H7249_18035 [Chitinophagaceae bacterium]|nr:hypothetical protein [Oligoflexus sp.]